MKIVIFLKKLKYLSATFIAKLIEPTSTNNTEMNRFYDNSESYACGWIFSHGPCSFGFMNLNSNTIFQIDLFLNEKIQSIFSVNGLNDVVDSLNIILINKHLDTSIKELLLDKEFTKMLIWVSLPILINC